MTKTVDFIFDFASPNGYFCHHAIPDIEARTGAKFVYKPCLLGGIFKVDPIIKRQWSPLAIFP